MSNFTTSLGADVPRNTNLPLKFLKGLARGTIRSIPDYLINYAKQQTGRHSIAYELMAKIRKRAFGMKRKRPYPIRLDNPPKRRKVGVELQVALNHNTV